MTEDETQTFERPEGDRLLNPGTGLQPAEPRVPDLLYILPLPEKPVFPGVMIPLVLRGERAMEVLKRAHEETDRYVGLVYAPESDHQEPVIPHDTGTAARILQTRPLAPDTVQVLVMGFHRIRRVLFIPDDKVERWRVRHLPDPPPGEETEMKAWMLSIGNEIKQLIRASPVAQEQLNMLTSQLNYNRPGVTMDIVSNLLTREGGQLQELLEAVALKDRARILLGLLKEEVELALIQKRIHKEVEETVNRQQKEFFLRQQLQAIKKELGLEKDGKETEIEALLGRLKKLKLSREARQVVDDEIRKLEILQPQSPEYHVSRNYLDWIADLPWGKRSKDNLSVPQARALLERDHYGLEDVKDLILEFLSSIHRKGRVGGSVICLVGPPGVGKTSIGHSIADALGRQFFRFSVGGMRDEAEIKGHRRTYIGAMPGKLIQALKRVGVSNPVIMLDEIDKIGSSFQGDPASALLEVLDPEQNQRFLDHYIDIPFDLSHVLFLTTANQLDTIPAPLLDRMEVIRLSGYILEDKIEIARRYLVPRLLRELKYEEDEIRFSDEVLRLIIDRYAREAGVRNLEKLIRKIIRKITLALTEGMEVRTYLLPEDVESFLGKPVFSPEMQYARTLPGTVTGLAYTAYGGSTLYIEASGIRSSSPGFKQTGQLGKVMQESAEIAYTHVRARLSEGMEANPYFNEHFIHLHVPAGATPKDGPSAGITMALALYSLATGQAVRKELAMTGELTLTGKVLAVGGIREKVIAARRADLKELILPQDNRYDFEELPAHIREGLIVRYADYFDDVIRAVYYP